MGKSRVWKWTSGSTAASWFTDHCLLLGPPWWKGCGTPWRLFPKGVNPFPEGSTLVTSSPPETITSSWARLGFQLWKFEDTPTL